MSPNPWPKSDLASIEAFYGKHRLGLDGTPSAAWQSENLVLLRTPFPFRLAWDPATTVNRVRCHRRVADSLDRVLKSILASFGTASGVRAVRADLLGGVYQFRRISGRKSLSFHSWGAGIDLDPDRNPLGTGWVDGTGMLPRAVIDAFDAEGWRWGGRFKRPDPMHFEAVSD